MSTLGHTSNLAIHPVPAVELAERLIALAGRPGRVFFCNSGTEANEAAFKVARLHRAKRESSPPRVPSTAAPWVRCR